MSNRITSPLALAATVALVAGCAETPWQPPPYERAIKAYYQAHASERNGQCLAPYIDGFTTIEVVEDGPEQMVVDARFLHRDWRKDGGDEQPFGGCIGYGERRFVLARTDGGLQVSGMSGARRS